jgi:hypothetical protein
LVIFLCHAVMDASTYVLIMLNTVDDQCLFKLVVPPEPIMWADIIWQVGDSSVDGTEE